MIIQIVDNHPGMIAQIVDNDHGMITEIVVIKRNWN